MHLYTESHEWIIVKGDNHNKVGITQYAAGELGEVVSIELPKIGQVVKMGQEVCVLESTKAAADIYAPVSGKVIGVNETLRENPSLINQDPEGQGWLFQMEIAHMSELEELMTKEQYLELIS